MTHTSKKFYSLLLCGVLSLALLAGCGGGGGGGSTSDTGSGSTSDAGGSTYSISGAAADSSNVAISGVTVALTGASTGSTTTESSGNYTFSGLADGSYTVTPSKTGYTFNPSSTAVTVSGANMTGQNFVGSATGGGGSTTGAVNLPKTGQTTSYATGDDGDLEIGVVWPDPRFTVGTGAEGDCVTDNLTGLMWVKNLDTTTRTWAEALTYANDLSLCGHTDWRVPNVNELVSLANASQSDNAAWLNAQGFSNVQNDPENPYWSSTTIANITGTAWVVGVDGHVEDGVSKTSDSYAWPVRSGQVDAASALPKTGQTTSYATGDDGDLESGAAWPDPRFTVGTEADCVTDNLTSLMWIKSPDSTSRTWADALTYANDLSLCGYSDWRMPNIKELRTLVNYGWSNSVDWLNTQGFSNVHDFNNDEYWSSTTDADSTDYAWNVLMAYGNVWYINKIALDPYRSQYVLPVRGGSE